MKKNQKPNYITAEQQKNYSLALRRIYAFQHRDGSWGEGNYKMPLTAQAIHLLLSLGFKSNNPRLKKAIRWFEDNVEKGVPHWTSKIEVGLKLGWFDSLYENGYISNFIDDLNHYLDGPNTEKVDSMNLFWDVLPTLIALYPFEKEIEKKSLHDTGETITIPHDRVIHKLETEFEIYGDNKLIAVGNKPNNTGLVALYLSTLSKQPQFEKYKEKSDAMLQWLYTTRQTDDDDNDTYWWESKSVTSYILMDLNRCLPKDDPRRANFGQILQFLTPDSRGKVGTDKVTTFNTAMHRDPTYISILVLRAVAEVLSPSSKVVKEINKMANEKDILKDIHYRISAIYSAYKGMIPLFLSIVLLVITVVLLFIGKPDDGKLIFSIACSAYLGMWFSELRASSKSD